MENKATIRGKLFQKFSQNYEKLRRENFMKKYDEDGIITIKSDNLEALVKRFGWKFLKKNCGFLGTEKGFWEQSKILKDREEENCEKKI